MSDLKIVAAGISNAGATVLRAAEIDRDGLLDAVVAGEPNLYAPESEAIVDTPEGSFSSKNAKPFIDYATLTGLYQPCAALVDIEPDAPFAEQLDRQREAFEDHCRTLNETGRLQSSSLTEMPLEASAALDSLLLTESARQLSLMNVIYDIWSRTTATMEQALSRRPVDDPICNIGFAMVDKKGIARPSTLEERSLWFGTSNGMPPTAGIELVNQDDVKIDKGAVMAEAFQCWRSLWESKDDVIQTSVALIQSTAKLPSIPIAIVHGRADSLINHSSRPYMAAARNLSNDKVYYYEVENGQHIDAVLANVSVRDNLVTLQPYFWHALYRIFEIGEAEKLLNKIS